MKAVDSKFNAFPWAFVYPKPPEGTTLPEHMGEINRWLLGHDLKYNRDYLHFEHTVSQGQFRDPIIHMVIAFKDRSKALMFKMAWA